MRYRSQHAQDTPSLVTQHTSGLACPCGRPGRGNASSEIRCAAKQRLSPAIAAQTARLRRRKAVRPAHEGLPPRPRESMYEYECMSMYALLCGQKSLGHLWLLLGHQWLLLGHLWLSPLMGAPHLQSRSRQPLLAAMGQGLSASRQCLVTNAKCSLASTVPCIH